MEQKGKKKGYEKRKMKKKYFSPCDKLGGFTIFFCIIFKLYITLVSCIVLQSSLSTVSSVKSDLFLQYNSRQSKREFSLGILNLFFQYDFLLSKPEFFLRNFRFISSV